MSFVDKSRELLASYLSSGRNIKTIQDAEKLVADPNDWAVLLCVFENETEAFKELQKMELRCACEKSKALGPEVHPVRLIYLVTLLTKISEFHKSPLKLREATDIVVNVFGESILEDLIKESKDWHQSRINILKGHNLPEDGWSNDALRVVKALEKRYK